MADVIEMIKKYPKGHKPEIKMTSLNEPIMIASDGIYIRPDKGQSPSPLDGDLQFRWTPTTAIEFEGKCKSVRIDHNKDEAYLIIPGCIEEAPVMVSNVKFSDKYTRVRGILKKDIIIGSRDSIDTIRFHLVDFPSTIGESIREGTLLSHGRMSLRGTNWLCEVDEIHENKDLMRRALHEGGYIITHVGEVRHEDRKPISYEDGKQIINSLYYYFTILCGTWCGPVFEMGLLKEETKWKRFASWKIRPGRRIQTWLPTHTTLSHMDTLFNRFLKLWSTEVWQKPLAQAIGWYAEANSPNQPTTSKIILCQIALEMLSWTKLVDSSRKYTIRQFKSKRFTAENKITQLLHTLNIPLDIPDHYKNIHRIDNKTLITSVPRIITKVRNALIHSTKSNRTLISNLDSWQLYEISQLGLNYLELALLSICKYNGAYSRRAWRGWKGDDEVLVPWS